jgi:hypothetical protein
MMRDKEAHRCTLPDPDAEARMVALFSEITGRLHRRPTLDRGIWRFLKGRRPMLPNVSLDLRRSAQALAEVLQTRFIILGHAHYPDAALFTNGNGISIALDSHFAGAGPDARMPAIYVFPGEREGAFCAGSRKSP